MLYCALRLPLKFRATFVARKTESNHAFVATLGSLSNHDYDGNKNPTNLHIWQWKTLFMHALHVHFHFLTFCRRSRSFYDVKWPVLQLLDNASVWWQMFNFVLSCPKRLFQFNSSIVRTHFSSITSLNNWKMIAETRSHIFRWRSCFRRRRVCLSSLLIREL